MDDTVHSLHLIRGSPLLSPRVIYLKKNIREERLSFSVSATCVIGWSRDNGGRVSTLSQE